MIRVVDRDNGKINMDRTVFYLFKTGIFGLLESIPARADHGDNPNSSLEA